MGVNVGEEGRTHKINELYSVELWFAPAAQPRWHVFSRFRHNICLVFFFAFFFFRIPKGIFKKLHNSPSTHFQTGSCRASQTILVFYLKSWLSTVEEKKKKSISTELHITLPPTSAKLSPSWEEHKLKSSIWAHREATRPWRVELLLSYSTGKPQGTRFFPR